MGSKLGATKAGSKLGAKKGLGAAKVSSGVSFEEAARKAQQEEVRVKKEKEAREQVEAEERKKAAEIVSKSPPASATASSKVPDVTPRSVTEAQRKKEEAQNVGLERLGMGVRKINLAAAASAPKPKKTAAVEDTTMYAREKFGNQKGTIYFSLVHS